MRSVLIVSVVFLTVAAFYPGCVFFTRKSRWYTMEQVEQGRRLYLRYCRECHGTSPVRDRPTARRRRREELRAIIRQGVPGTAMFGYEKRLTAQQMEALVAYLLWIFNRDRAQKF